MARIVVLGAAGRGGRALVSEAADRGHEVVACARNETSAPWPKGVQVVTGDATSDVVVRALLPGSDVIAVTLGGEVALGFWADVARRLCDMVAELPESRPRVIHLGGGASLLTADGSRILDTDGFPEAFRDAALGQAAALDVYRRSRDVDWTYFSPPPVDFFAGERTGTYRTATNHPVVDESGASRLSYADFAVAIVDEIEAPRHVRERFTAAY